MECMERLRIIQRKYTEVLFGTSRAVIDSNISGISKLNDSVYEFYRPENGINPNVEVVLFHGVYRGDASKAYLETWTCSDGSTSHCWPKTWVAKRFPRARILSVSYDSSIKKGPRQGRVDLHCVAENLIQDLTDMFANVGTRDACPLILVGHGFGGLVIKAVCLEAIIQAACLEASDRRRRMETFLSNVKAILFYSTPQLGLSNVGAEFNGELATTLGWGNKDIARLNDKFQKVRKAKKWAAQAILAGYPGKEPRFDAKEASVRFDVDEFYTAQEDIDTICKPREDTSITVTSLIGIILDCIASRSGPGGATERRVKLTSSLLFENDEYYVPMERSRDEVRNALNSPGVRIVVLHGLPGSGKSSLAKHLALWFADESNVHFQDEGTAGTSSDSGPRSYFIDGVVYLTCGAGAAVIRKQEELLGNFNVTLDVDNEGRLDEDGLHRKLGDHLKDLKALVILDDIWERKLLEMLVVPGQIKYLVTTQVTTLWSGYNVKNVPIQNACKDDARKILGNYAGFRDGMIPEELMGIADDLIESTESHPLALTTLAMVINDGDKTAKEEWREVRENFLHCLKSQQRAIGFAKTYPRTVYSALTSSLELLDDSEKLLLYTIAQFQGSIIPEYIVQLFFESTQPERSWKTTYSARKRLESLGLVQRAFFIFTFDHFSPQKHRTFAIHGLRQQFILSRMLDYPDDSIMKFVARTGSLLYQHEGLECERDLATVLCSLFGVTIIKEAAIRKLGTQFIWSDFSKLVYLEGVLSYFVSLMVKETEGAKDDQLHIAKAATEVFWKLFDKGELDDDNMSFLLREKTTRLLCAALRRLIYIFGDTRHAVRVLAVPSFTNRVIDLLDSTEEILQIYALHTIGLLAYANQNKIPLVKISSLRVKRIVHFLSLNKYPDTQKAALATLLLLTEENPLVMEILETPGLIESVVMLLSKDTEGRCEIAADLIYTLAKGGSQPTIVRTPWCLQRLVALLAPAVNEGAQKSALHALTRLAATRDSLVSMEILGTPGLLENVVMHLSKDTEGRCEAAADLSKYTGGRSEAAATLIRNLAMGGLQPTIVRTPLCLQRLVALLAPDVNEGAQKSALHALTRLAATRDSLVSMEILGTPGLLENVVMHLSKDTEGRCEAAADLSKYTWGRSEAAAALIRNLAMGGLQPTIVRTPLCLQRLVALLAPDVNEGAQKEALHALTKLAASRESLVLMEILGTPGLLENVVMHLSKDTKGRCEAATELICNLAMGGLQPTIVRTPLCLQRLVALLAPDENEGAQKAALRALAHLAATHESFVLMEILGTPGLMESVVMLLSKDTEGKCETAAYLIGNLARWGLAPTIVRTPLCLQRLVALLARDVNEGAQKEALKALTKLACNESHESLVLMEILGTPSLMESLVMLLSKDTEGKCETAAYLICHLAKGGSQPTIVRTPLCLQRLVALLAPDVSECAQRLALMALTNLATTHESLVLMEILGTPGLLENVVMHLSKDTKGRCEAAADLSKDSGGRSKAAAGLIGNLAVGGLQPTVVRTPLCLQRLVALLAPDENEGTQKVALQALTNLAVTHESLVLMEILGTPGLLESVVMLLAEDMEGKCEAAGKLIGYLARAPGNRLAIAQFPLCLEWLIGLLAPHVDEVISKWAVFALASLGRYDENEVDRKRLAVGGLLGSSVLLPTENSLAGAMLSSPEYSVRGVIEGLLTKTLVAGKASLELYKLWSEADLELKDYPRALIYITKALEVNVDNGSLLLMRGFLQWLMGDFPGALADFNKALEVNAENGSMWQERGVLRRFMGDFPGALEDLNKALQLDPDDYEMLKHRGLVKFMMEDEEGARADAERAILVKPSRIEDGSYGQGCLGVLSVEFLEYALK